MYSEVLIEGKLFFIYKKLTSIGVAFFTEQNINAYFSSMKRLKLNSYYVKFLKSESPDYLINGFDNFKKGKLYIKLSKDERNNIEKLSKELNFNTRIPTLLEDLIVFVIKNNVTENELSIFHDEISQEILDYSSLENFDLIVKSVEKRIKKLDKEGI